MEDARQSIFFFFPKFKQVEYKRARGNKDRAEPAFTQLTNLLKLKNFD